MSQTVSVSQDTIQPALSWFEQTFLDYIQDGDLRLPRYIASQRWVPLTARPEETDGIEWVPAEGSATLYSFVRYHRQYASNFSTPYNVILVELSEGLRLISTVDIDDLSRLRIDMPLKAVFTYPGRLSFVPQQ